MSSPLNLSLPHAGAGHQPARVQVPRHAQIHLSVHICPAGFVTWRLTERGTQRARYGTLTNVDTHGRSVPLTMDTAGDFDLTWAAACATQAWFACSVIHYQGTEQYRETIARNNDLTPILFGYGIRVMP